MDEPPPGSPSTVTASPSLWARGLPGLRRLVLHPLFIGFVLMVLGWPTTALAPQAGIDRSWQAILAMSQATYHFQWGPRLVFTFGPLAFLYYPALYSFGTGLAAFTYLALLRWALFASLAWALRRPFGQYLSIPIAYAVGVAIVVFAQPELVDGIIFIWAVAALRARVDTPIAERWLVPAAGAICAVAMLEKSNVGVIALAECVVTIVALSAPAVSFPRGRRRRAGPTRRLAGPTRRRAGPTRRLADPATPSGGVPAYSARRCVSWLLVFLGSFAVTFVVGWLATGNALGNIARWASGAFEVASGYSSAMEAEAPGSGTDYWRVVGVVVIVGVILLVNWRRDRRDGLRSWPVPLLALIVLYGGFKEGFVRHNLHSLVFFFLAVVVVAGLASVRRDRVPVALGLALTVLFLFQANAGVPPATYDPVASVRNLGSDALHLAIPAKTAALQREARAAMRGAYAAEGLTSKVVAPLAGHSVLVDPWTESVLWAYPKLRLDPLPVFGEYSAYTPSLDDRDRAFVVSRQGPDDILRQAVPGLDGRYAYFESPATQLAMACRYRQREISGSWAVLVRSQDRCGTAISLGSVHVSRATQTVTVPSAPSPDDAVVAQLHLSPPWWYGLLATLFKPPAMSMVVNGTLDYRFIPATAPDPDLLQPSADLGYTGPFTPVTIRTFRLAGTGVATWTLTVHFSAIPLRP